MSATFAGCLPPPAVPQARGNRPAAARSPFGGEPIADNHDIDYTDHDIEITYRIDITPKLVYSILAPFIWTKFREQLNAVLPISAFLFIFQLAVLRQGIDDAIAITLGLVVVILGLMFFMEGLRLGLMPLGEIIGATLP